MKPGIDITRTFPADAQRIFSAWTVGEQLAQWFAPPDSTSTATCDPTVGGAWSLTMGTPDEAQAFYGSYTAVNPPHHLAFTMQTAEGDGTETCTVDLAPHADGCEMRFTQGGNNLTIEQYHEATAGWAVFFERLDALTRN